MKNNNLLDPMMVMATFSLYGLENQKIVEEHFDEFIAYMRIIMNESDYREKISSLKPKGKICGGITLPRKDNTFCFASKIWYTIHKSSSDYYEWYWLKIGVNIRRDKYNPMNLSKIYINRIAGGKLGELIEKVHSQEFAENAKKRLCEWVYESCNDAIVEMFNCDNDNDKNNDDNLDGNILIDFGIKC